MQREKNKTKTKQEINHLVTSDLRVTLQQLKLLQWGPQGGLNSWAIESGIFCLWEECFGFTYGFNAKYTEVFNSSFHHAFTAKVPQIHVYFDKSVFS